MFGYKRAGWMYYFYFMSAGDVNINLFGCKMNQKEIITLAAMSAAFACFSLCLTASKGQFRHKQFARLWKTLYYVLKLCYSAWYFTLLGTQTDAVSPDFRDVGTATDTEDCGSSFLRHSTPTKIRRISEELIIPEDLNSSYESSACDTSAG